MVRRAKFSCDKRFASSLICHRSTTGRRVGYWAPYRFVGRNGHLNAGLFSLEAKSEVLEVPFGNYPIYNNKTSKVIVSKKSKKSGPTHKPCPVVECGRALASLNIGSTKLTLSTRSTISEPRYQPQKNVLCFMRNKCCEFIDGRHVKRNQNEPRL